LARFARKNNCHPRESGEPAPATAENDVAALAQAFITGRGWIPASVGMTALFSRAEGAQQILRDHRESFAASAFSLWASTNAPGRALAFVKGRAI
jgi:hypothetical protein